MVPERLFGSKLSSVVWIFLTHRENGKTVLSEICHARFSLSTTPLSLSPSIITQSSYCTHAYLTADEAFPLNIFSPTQMSVIQHTQPDATLWNGARGFFHKQSLNGSCQVHYSQAWPMWCHGLFPKPHTGRWKIRKGIPVRTFFKTQVFPSTKSVWQPQELVVGVLHRSKLRGMFANYRQLAATRHANAAVGKRRGYGANLTGNNCVSN